MFPLQLISSLIRSDQCLVTVRTDSAALGLVATLRDTQMQQRFLLKDVDPMLLKVPQTFPLLCSLLACLSRIPALTGTALFLLTSGEQCFAGHCINRCRLARWACSFGVVFKLPATISLTMWGELHTGQLIVWLFYTLTYPSEQTCRCI